jgi:uncharacterized protein DUF5336
MSGYPVPPAQPSSRGRGGARVAETPKSVLLERVGAGLGVLMFVWGFLPWYGLAATDVNGYGFGSPAPVAIGLSLLASGVAAARMLDQKAASPLVPLAAAAVALLVSFGLIVDRGDNVSLNVGLILAVVTTLLQTAAFALAWLHEIGRLGVGAQSEGWSGNTPYGYATPEAGNSPGSTAYPAPTPYVGQSGYPQSGYGAAPGYGETQVMTPGSANPYGYPPAGTPYQPSPTGYSQRYGQPGTGSPYATGGSAPHPGAAPNPSPSARSTPTAPAAPTAPSSFGQHSLREPDDVDGTTGTGSGGR